ncbi:hypothetical protein LI328DRAFT_128352 [Trichoderma asperelloides]|nr:hypothetical protein LI328DRAFT_128352 [Trichoderma asperelloides]
MSRALLCFALLYLNSPKTKNGVLARKEKKGSVSWYQLPTYRTHAPHVQHRFYSRQLFTKFSLFLSFTHSLDRSFSCPRPFFFFFFFFLHFNNFWLVLA